MQESTELVSIIIPVYNAELYIGRCIDSILKQSYRNFEILAINDGSIDGTSRILRELQNCDSRIHIFEQSNKGVSAARNKGIENIRGRYFTFIDADDYWEPETLYKAVKYIVDSNSDVITYGWNKIDYESGILEKCNENDIIESSIENILDKILQNYSAYGGGYPWNKLWKISDSVRPLYFDEKLYYFEDLEWVVRMILQIHRMKISSECLYNYIVHKTSVTNNPANKERNELSYHMAIKSIIHQLNRLPDLQKKIEEKYSSEIINGIVHAQRNNWEKVEQYLWQEMLLKWKSILKMNLSIRVKIRCVRLVLFNKGKK